MVIDAQSPIAELLAENPESTPSVLLEAESLPSLPQARSASDSPAFFE
jgi:hypothetical protein